MKPLKKSLSSNEITKQSSPKKSLLKRSASSNEITKQSSPKKSLLKGSTSTSNYIAEEYPRFCKAIYKLVVNSFKNFKPKAEDSSFYKNLYKMRVAVPTVIDEYIARHLNDAEWSWDATKDFINAGGKNIKYKNISAVKNIDAGCEKLLKAKGNEICTVFRVYLNVNSIKFYQSVAQSKSLLDDLMKQLKKKNRPIGNLDAVCKECYDLTHEIDNKFPDGIESSFFGILKPEDLKTLKKYLKDNQKFINEQLKKGKED